MNQSRRVPHKDTDKDRFTLLTVASLCIESPIESLSTPPRLGLFPSWLRLLGDNTRARTCWGNED